MDNTVISIRGLSIEFNGFKAVDGVDLDILRGETHALLGPNGAGKTTLFNMITKMLMPSSGTIRLEGADITHAPPQAVARMGLVRSFQISAIFPQMTTLENVRIALQRTRGTSYDFWRSGRVLRSMDDEARLLLSDVGLESYENLPAGLLSYGRKRALEFATTLALKPKVLLLDEPTAGMNVEDIARVIELIKRIRVGRTVLLVEHNLSVVRDLCDRITVLARGKVLAAGDYRTVSKNRDVVEAYLGTVAVDA